MSFKKEWGDAGEGGSFLVTVGTGGFVGSFCRSKLFGVKGFLTSQVGKEGI